MVLLVNKNMQIIEQSKERSGGPMLSGDGSKVFQLASLSVRPSIWETEQWSEK